MNAMVQYQGNISKIQEIAKATNLMSLSVEAKFGNAFAAAEAVQKLRELINPEMMSSVMELQGSSLGFKTDKDREKGYPVAVVKDCLITATLYGLNPVGNEWNIIAGNFYVTKNGFKRLLQSLPGISGLTKNFDMPKHGQGSASVQCRAKWKYNGEENSIGYGEDVCIIPIRVNSGMGDDAILGKADRKLMARIWERVTGSSALTDGEAEDVAIKDINCTVTSDVDRNAQAIDAAKAQRANDVFMARIDEIGAAQSQADMDACVAKIKEVEGDLTAAHIDELRKAFQKKKTDLAKNK